MNLNVLKSTFVLIILNTAGPFVYERLNQPGPRVYHLATSWDSAIPVLSPMAIPYLSFYALPVATLLLVYRKDRIRGINCLLTAMAIAMAIAFLCYANWQTTVDRPELTGNLTWTQELLRTIYTDDKPYNCCPSLHCAISAVCAIEGWRLGPFRIPLLLWSTIIILSTLFVKQHDLADVVAGIGLAFLSSGIATRIERFMRGPTQAISGN